MRLCLVFLVVLLAPLSAWADERANVKQELATEQAKAQALGQDRAAAEAALKAIQRKAAAGANKLQAAEENLTKIETTLAHLQAEIAVGEADLAQDEDDLNQTLAALLRLSRRPPETAILAPGKVIDRLRTARLLSDLGRQVEEKAESLRLKLAALETLYQQTETAREQATAAAHVLQDEQQKMAVLLAERQQKIKKLDLGLKDRQRRIKNLAAKAKSLDAMMAALALAEAAGLPHPRPKGEKLTARGRKQAPRAPQSISRPSRGKAFSSLKGRLTLPVRGPVVARFGGQSSEFLTGLRGLMVEARPNAQVTIPVDGEILYSGPFRSYGGLLIVDVGNGYHMLIAGLARIDAEVGQRLLAGEPVGQMGAGSNESSHKSPNSAQLSATDGVSLGKTGARKARSRASSGGGQGNHKPQLYFELRKAGKPIDPWVWLAPAEKKNGKKVRG
ncbi:MAG: murein hydrolase activator EnvC family protein [Alphaproteobacteria bacterium]